MSRHTSAEIPSYGSASDPHRDGMIHKLLAEVKELRATNSALFTNAHAARLEIRRVEKAGAVSVGDFAAIELALDGWTP